MIKNLSSSSMFFAGLFLTLLLSTPSVSRSQVPIHSSQASINREIDELFKLLMDTDSFVRQSAYKRIDSISANASADVAEQITEGLITKLERQKIYEPAFVLASELARFRRSLGRADEAIKTAERAIRFAERLGDKEAEVDQLDFIARIHSERDQFRASNEVRARALKTARSSGIDRLIVTELLNYGFSMLFIGEHVGAIDLWNEAILLAKKNGFLKDVGIAHRYKGMVFLQNFFYAPAFEEFSLAVNYLPQLSPFDEFWIRKGLAESLFALGRADESLPHFERAISLATEVNRGDELVDLYIEFGIALARARRYVEAGDSYTKAVELARKGGGKDREKLYEALNRTGYFHVATRNFDSAERDYQEVLEEASKDSLQYLQVLLGLGQVFFEQQRFEEALVIFKEGLSRSKAGKWQVSELGALLGVGATEAKLGRHAEAEKSFGELYQRIANLGFDESVGATLSIISEWTLERGRLEEARSDLQQAYVILNWNGRVELEIFALYNLMLANDRLGDRDVAVAYGKRLINLLQDARNQFRYQTDAFKKKLFEDKIKFYRGLADILIDLGRLPEAEQVLTMLKEDEFTEFVRNQGSRAGETELIALTAQESEFLGQLKIYIENYSSTATEYLELTRLKEALRGTDKFDEKLFKSVETAKSNAERDLNSFFASYRGGSGFSKSEVVPETSKIQEQLESLKQGNVASISTVVGDKRLRLILTTGDGQQTFTVNTERAEVNRLVAQFRAELLNPMSDPKPAGKKLFDLVFPKELVSELERAKIETLLWSLDGALRYVPIAALWDGERYVVERYNTVMLSLAGGERQFEASNGLRNEWKGLGLGTSRDVTVRQPDGKTTTFSALYAVPEEICSVVNDKSEGSPCMEGISVAPGKIDGRALIDEQFTIESFKQNVSAFPVVHVASHFYLNPGNDRESFLLLGGGNDPRLTLDAISTDSISFNQVELLTLSACNTAVGSGVGSDGFEVEGFGVLALSKGARTVVASLWPVADNSTRDLMISFYDGLSGSGMSRANALRRAQLRLLRGASADGESQRAAKFAHPYYWSPFMLIGNWQ